jgi:hypothetical protein
VAGGAALLGLVLLAAAVAVVRRVHSGSEDRQELTSQVVAADLAVIALLVTLLGLTVGVRRLRRSGVAAAKVVEDAAVGAVGGRHSVLGQVDLEVLGVRRPRQSTLRLRQQLPYVPRAADARLRTALAAHRFVLVHGQPGSGRPARPRRPAKDCSAAGR